MALTIQNLTAYFGAEITGLNLIANVDDTVVSEIKAALDKYSVLVFRNQRFDDETQTAFSARFGALETTVYKPEGDGGVPVANITNIDYRTNEIFPEGHTRLKSNSGNEMWHTDSSFKPTPAYCSMLSGREVPPIGADTQFASCRTAYDLLPAAERLQLDGLVAEHNYGHSRSLVKGYEAPKQTLKEVPPVRHAVVRTNPSTGRKNIAARTHRTLSGGQKKKAASFYAISWINRRKPNLCMSINGDSSILSFGTIAASCIAALPSTPPNTGASCAAPRSQEPALQ